MVSAGRPGRSTELGVVRPSRSTDMHKRARHVWLEGRSTDPIDRPESSALWKAPVNRVDRQRVLLSVPGHGRPGRSTEAPTVEFLSVGGRPGRSTDSRPGC